MLAAIAAMCAEQFASPYWATFLLACVMTVCFAGWAYLSRSKWVRVMVLIAFFFAAVIMVMTGYGMLVFGT